MMAAEEQQHPSGSVDELQRAFRTLCGEYEDVVDEATEVTQPVDERIGLALFKIDEATDAADAVLQEAEAMQTDVMDALLENCRELEVIFIHINLMENYVTKVHTATKELEKRTDTISKVSGPVFNTGSVSTLLRGLALKRSSAQEPADTKTLWDPLDLNLDAHRVLQRLDKSSADELGVSILNRVEAAATPSS